MNYCLVDTDPSVELSDVMEQNTDDMRQAGEMLTRLFRAVNGARVSDSAVSALAHRLVRTMGSKINVGGVFYNLRAVFDYVEKGKYINWQHVMNYAQAIVLDVINESAAAEPGSDGDMVATPLKGLGKNQAAFVTATGIFMDAYDASATAPIIGQYEALLGKVGVEWKARRVVAVKEARALAAARKERLKTTESK
jgi:hypothetical protein